MVTIKQRLQDKMKEWGEIKNIDENRLEQEIIYYLEKLDITEEKVRLANHCKYFVETVEKEEAPGRKLDSSPKKSVAKSIPWVPKPMIMTSRNWLFA